MSAAGDSKSQIIWHAVLNQGVTCGQVNFSAHPRCKNRTLTSDVKQRIQRSQHNTPNANNSHKTKKNFTGFYTDGKHNFSVLTYSLSKI